MTDRAPIEGPSLGASTSALLKRDLRLALRNRAELVTPPAFFVLVVALFPLAMRPDPQVLQTIAPAVVWVIALLATLLSLERLFKGDLDDGSLELLVLAPAPLGLLVLAKTVAHWLLTGLPLVLLSPALAYSLALSGEAVVVLMLSLLLGTPVLSLIGAIGVALTLGLRQAGGLLAILILPLFVPVLIFGAGAAVAAAQGLPYQGPLLMVAALLLLALTLAPIATAAALRISLN